MLKVIAVLAGFASLLVAGTALGSFYTVGQSERAVVTRWGAVVDTTGPGLHFKTPWISGTHTIPVDDRTVTYKDVSTYSSDQQPANITFSVSYRLSAGDAAKIYAQYGGADGVVSRLIDRQALKNLKDVFGQYNAVTAIQERSKLNADVTDAIRSAVKGPVDILSVQIENIDYSKAYEQSIEDRMKAEVEVQKVQQNAQREKINAQIAVTKAQAKADATLAMAKAQANATKLKGDAEASAIAARGKALKDNPNVIDLVRAERWDGKLPTTMVPGAAVPFVSVK